MGERFDRYVVVDWSAAARPVTGPNSIWIAVVDAAFGDEPRLSNPSTRRRAEAEIGAAVAGSSRTLVAIDASFGYPAGTARWFDLAGEPPWRAMWCHLAEHVVDDETNANNRFEVAAELNRRRGGAAPFWGRPVRSPLLGLEVRKPSSFPVPEYRLVEERLRAGGHRPASAWQLAGAGSVGSQTLTLLPWLYRSLGSVDVWPFTTGLAPPATGRPVVVETWPTAFDLDLSDHPVRDAAQVAGVARRLRAADAAGQLTRWFVPDVDPADRAVVESEEGWVLAPPVRTGPVG